MIAPSTTRRNTRFFIGFLFASTQSLSLVADTWTVERIAYNLQTAEGPVWDADRERLYFTEIFANQIHEYTASSGAMRIVRKDSGGSNGMAFDSNKRLLMCEMRGRRVSRINHDGTIATLWQAEGDGKGGPNDIVVSSTGNAYFTMPRHKRVYRIAPDGTIDVFIDELAGINGVKLSRDEKTLYVTEYRNRRVHAFSIDEVRGTVGTGRLFASIQTDEDGHGADGMAVDRDDRLYVSCLGGIWIFNTQGQQVGLIRLPNEKVTNCAFAGDDFNTLYITTQKGLFRASR